MKMLNQMIEVADANRRIVDGRPHDASICIQETTAGKVICYRDYTVAGSNMTRRHTRTNWKLNGKAISFDALAKALGCIEVAA